MRRRRDQFGSHRRPARTDKPATKASRPPRDAARKPPSPEAQAGNVVRRIVEENVRLRSLTPLERAALHPTQRPLSNNTITQYRRSLTTMARTSPVPLDRITPAQAFRYLQERGAKVQQNTLNAERLAVQRMMWADGRLPQGETIRGPRRPGEEHRIPEGRPPNPTARALSSRQIDDVVAELQRRQDVEARRRGHAVTDHAFVARLIAATGIRAHEAISLARSAEQPPDDRSRIQQSNHDRIVDRLKTRTPRAARDLRAGARHADVRRLRFLGRTGGVRYTVVGKGGLVREILVPRQLHSDLEDRRLPRPAERSDRGIRYEQRYSFLTRSGPPPSSRSRDAGGGQAFSSAWTRASKAAVGWSTGAHGLRHSYVQDRMRELRPHLPQALAKLVVSHEVGHQRDDVTNTYLR